MDWKVSIIGRFFNQKCVEFLWFQFVIDPGVLTEQQTRVLQAVGRGSIRARIGAAGLVDEGGTCGCDSAVDIRGVFE